MIDPLTSLAFSIQSQPGVYAVMVGSGVSRDAQIPTGWGIVEQLLRQLAATRDEEIDGDPAEWYSHTFGMPVGFSTLIHELAPARTERQALLRQFIEPDPARPDERRPTPAHRALAQLAKSGHIRVFLTTNFDRLLEQALEAEGMSPVVVSTPAGAAGAAPFHHESVVVFKLHGDYLDPDSMLVTEDELSAYGPATGRRLASTLEDYGLVACGWSAEWDPALRDAITAATARRYPMYFASLKVPLAEPARGLVESRQGVALQVDDANTFLTTLAKRVASIDALNEPHPLDTAALVAAVKHALPRPERRIDLDDLVSGTAQRVSEQLTDVEAFPQYREANGFAWDKAYIEQVSRVFVAVRPLAEVLAACAAWGESVHSAVMTRAMARVAVGFDPTPGTVQDNLVALRRLPALLCLYAGGAAAVARGNYAHLKALCVDPTVVLANGQGKVPLITQLNVHTVMPKNLADAVARFRAEPDGLDDEALKSVLASRTRYHAPVAQLLKQWASDIGQPYVLVQEMDATFGRLELLLDLLAEHELAGTKLYMAGPSFGLYANHTHGIEPEADLLDELELEGASWGPVAQGLFGGSTTKATETIEALQRKLVEVRQQRW